MRFALLTILLTIVAGFVPRAYSQVKNPTVRQVPSRVSDYCTTERFQNYILVAKAMRDYVSPENYSRLYIPLKVKASKAQVTLKNYGPLSSTTHTAVLELVKYVNDNQREFDALWEIEAFFEIARDLMDMTMALSRELE